MSARARKVVFGALVLLGIGALYAVFVNLTHIGIPCVFNLLTGLRCPGCGVTRMCIALLKLDFKTAFYENPAVFCMIPLAAAVTARLIYMYIRYGRKSDKYTNIALYFMIAVLIVFGIVRNIIHI